jgi:hypothetical protein
MKSNGFKEIVGRGETVIVLDTQHGVSHIETEDGIQDFVHMHDLEEIKDAEKLPKPN